MGGGGGPVPGKREEVERLVEKLGGVTGGCKEFEDGVREGKKEVRRQEVC